MRLRAVEGGGDAGALAGLAVGVGDTAGDVPAAPEPLVGSRGAARRDADGVKVGAVAAARRPLCRCEVEVRPAAAMRVVAAILDVEDHDMVEVLQPAQRVV